MNYYYRGPSIDHSLLSPSGRVSKRARKAAEAREVARLFPPTPAPEPNPEAVKAAQGYALLRAAANLRELAARGMSTRKYLREAAKLEAQAEAL